jgi:hypothetical protein
MIITNMNKNKNWILQLWVEYYKLINEYYINKMDGYRNMQKKQMEIVR